MVIFIYSEGIAIVLVEAIAGAYSDKTPAVLQDTIDGALREALFGGEVLELEAVFLAKGHQRPGLEKQ